MKTKNHIKAKPQLSVWTVCKTVGLPVLALLVVAAFGYDYYQRQHGDRQQAQPLEQRVMQDLQHMVIHAGEQQYRDPEGRFVLDAPPGWARRADQKSDADYSVYFRGPGEADLGIIATRVNYNYFPSLLKRIRSTDRDIGISPELTVTNLYGRETAVRSMIWGEDRHIMMFDFITQHVAHHIQFTAPAAHFDSYKTVLMDLLSTYQPLNEER